MNMGMTGLPPVTLPTLSHLAPSWHDPYLASTALDSALPSPIITLDALEQRALHAKNASQPATHLHRMFPSLPTTKPNTYRSSSRSSHQIP